MLAITPRRANRARSSRAAGQRLPLRSALPFTSLLTRISNAIVRLFGVDPGDIEEKHTSDDLQGDHQPARPRAASSTPARR